MSGSTGPYILHLRLIFTKEAVSAGKYFTKGSLPTGGKDVIISLVGKKCSSLKTQPSPAYGLFKFILLRFIPLNGGSKNGYINNIISGWEGWK